MKFLKLIPAFFVIMTFAFGCSKDKDEVSELEQEVMEEQGEDYIAETGSETDTSAAEKTVETPEPGVTPEPAPATQVYEKTPEAAPAEEPREQYIPPTGPGYTIQVASGTNESYAKYLADKYVNRGYQAYVDEAIVNGVSVYRIRIGKYGTTAEARQVGEEIKDKYSVNYWIDRSQ